MLLFIPDLGSSSSHFLPLICYLTKNLGSSDKQLLDNFCLRLPGHDLPDSNFDTAKCLEKMEAFLLENRVVQSLFSSRLLLLNFQLMGQILAHPQVTLIASGAGAILALEFAKVNPGRVRQLILLNPEVNYFGLDKIKSPWWQQFVFRQNPSFNQVQNTKNLDKKTLLSILSEYPERRGLKSYLQILINYDLTKLSSSISPKQAKAFQEIPLLIVWKGTGLWQKQKSQYWQKNLPEQKIEFRQLSSLQEQLWLNENLETISELILSQAPMLDSNGEKSRSQKQLQHRSNLIF